MFCLLFYIMCVIIFNLSVNKLDMDVVDVISIFLNNNIIVNFLLYLVFYMYDDGNVVEIKYDFIVIVLIYVLMRKLEYFWIVLKVYDNIRILEFVCFDDLYVRFY